MLPLERREAVMGRGGGEMSGSSKSPCVRHLTRYPQLPDYECKRILVFRVDRPLQDKNVTEMWIGATDQKEEDIWTWTDCSPWNFTKWRSSKQPNNSETIDGDGENCAVLHNNISEISRGLKR